jgi:cytochrome c556
MIGAQPAIAAPLPPAKAKALMHHRHEQMELIRDNLRVAMREFSRPTPDMAAIAKAAATMNRLAHQASGWFPAGTGPNVGKTMAKAEIWKNRKDFDAKMAEFQKGTAAFNAAARTGDAAAAKAALGNAAKNCKACHDLYRTEH